MYYIVHGILVCTCTRKSIHLVCGLNLLTRSMNLFEKKSNIHNLIVYQGFADLRLTVSNTQFRPVRVNAYGFLTYTDRAVAWVKLAAGGRTYPQVGNYMTRWLNFLRYIYPLCFSRDSPSQIPPQNLVYGRIKSCKAVPRHLGMACPGGTLPVNGFRSDTDMESCLHVHTHVERCMRSTLFAALEVKPDAQCALQQVCTAILSSASCTLRQPRRDCTCSCCRAAPNSGCIQRSQGMLKLQLRLPLSD